MKEITFKSSAMMGGAYDAQNQSLTIRFLTGEQYIYHRVPAGVVQALQAAPSQGQYFNSAIRGRFSFVRLS